MKEETRNFNPPLRPQFFEMNSATKGYGGKMVNAVLKDLPEEWDGVVVIDWSDGFWD
jgi:hypothetical protein